MVAIRNAEMRAADEPSTIERLGEAQRRVKGWTARIAMGVTGNVSSTDLSTYHENLGIALDDLRATERDYSIEGGLSRFASKLTPIQLANLALTLFESHGHQLGDVTIQTASEDLASLQGVAEQRAMQAKNPETAAQFVGVGSVIEHQATNLYSIPEPEMVAPAIERSPITQLVAIIEHPADPSPTLTVPDGFRFIVEYDKSEGLTFEETVRKAAREQLGLILKLVEREPESTPGSITHRWVVVGEINTQQPRTAIQDSTVELAKTA